MKDNNSGFSLIELVVAVAVLAIASLAIFEFAVVSSNNYSRQTKEVELQYESQLTMNQLQEVLVDATKAVSYAYSDGGTGTLILSDADIDPAVTVTEKTITVYNSARYYEITWDPGDHKLYYSEYHREPDDTWSVDASGVLMAEFVEDFSLNLSDMDKNGSLSLNLKFKKDKEYEVSQNIKLRNKVAVNATFSEVYP